MTEALGSIQALAARTERAAEEASQDEASQDEVICSEALDPVNLGLELMRIDALLAKHNLRARAEVEALVERVIEPRLRNSLEAVQQAVRRFDFKSARAGIAGLREQLEGKPD